MEPCPVDPWPHILEHRERLTRVETKLEQMTERPGLMTRLGFNVLSRDLLLAIALIWAIIAGREDIAAKLILGL